MDDTRSHIDAATTPAPAAYYAVAVLFLLCAVGYWMGGGENKLVVPAVVGLLVVAAVAALRGYRLRRDRSVDEAR